MRFVLLLLLCAPSAAWASERDTDWGSEFEITHRALPRAHHANDQESLQRALVRAKAYSDKLKAERGTALEVDDHTVELKWPVRKSIIVTDPHIQTIDAYYDHDTNQGSIVDWKCGDQTYDGHNGTDFSIHPYSWYRMRKDHGIVVAGAAGVIIDKEESQPEDSCDFNFKEANSITIEHADGSLAQYAHMRTNSLNRKPLGAMVTAGEYLGVIGSAGISSGPHLHLNVGFWEQQGNILRLVEQDPWEGACNEVNDNGWWETQPEYLNPALMSLGTHNKQPGQPPCPQSEDPHFSNSFAAGDEIFFTIVVRDQPANVAVAVQIKQPNGVVWNSVALPNGDDDVMFASVWTLLQILPNDAQAGEWTLEVTLNSEMLSHAFWVDAAPPEPPAIPITNNAFNGLWYDPALDGEGYNFITSPSGTVIFFYGGDEDGNRLWLISETVQSAFEDGKQKRILMYESTGGVHSAPMKSARGLSVWGELRVTFHECGSGTAILKGIDGEKTSSIVKLAAVPGTNCSSGNRADNAQSGLWFNSGLDGEGFNLIVAPNGVVIFYYGFDKDGNRLWLISQTIPDVINTGGSFQATLFKATIGTFDAPVPSGQSLEDWGMLTVKVNGCNAVDYTLDTKEGDKVSASVRLAGILGLNCP